MLKKERAEPIIGHFVYNYWGYSGAANQAKKLAKELGGSDLVNVFFDSPSIGDKINFKVNRDTFNNALVISLPSSVIFKSLAIILFSLKYKVNIFHLHGFHRLAIFFAVLLRRKVFLKTTLLGKDDFCALSCSRINKYLISKVDLNNSLTPEIEKINNKYYSGSICVIPNGVDIFDKVFLEKENLAIIVGAVVPRKNPLQGIQHFKNGLSKLGYKLILAGPNQATIPEFDVDYYKSCVDEAINHDVIFVGNLDRDELIQLYKKAKIIIFLSDREGLPNVLIEALSFNVLPIVNPNDMLMQYVLGDALIKNISPLLSNGENMGDAIESLIVNGDAQERSYVFSMGMCASLHKNAYLEVLKSGY
ncbi:glycosyltransferase [Aeromonas media]|uniref:glycosyltransferase n=1 Tax=Aeromonas media TaxID=651 RepID=UPI00227E52B1|nr:glycosyltransferase [Aeromonas media]MCY9821473.1 glycosyltransferase [Aeromonas media]